MFISLVLPVSCLVAGMWVTAAMLSAPSGEEHALRLVQQAFRRAHDETLWTAIGGMRGIRSRCGYARYLVRTVHTRADLPKTYCELRFMLWRLYAVSIYCICVEAPLKATILPRIPRDTAWKIASLYTEMVTEYEEAIEI